MAFKHLKAGLSLVEFLVAFGVITFVVTMVGAIYFANFRLYSNQNAVIDISTQNRISLTDITNQIRQSAAVASTCGSCGGTTSSATSLVLQLWPIDGTGEPFDPGTTNFDYIVYKRDQSDTSKLVRYTYPFGSSSRPSGTRILATNVSNLQFAYDNADPTQSREITITLTSSTNSGTKNITTTDTDKATLRNK